MELIWFWIGGLTAVLWLSLAADAIVGKTPWRECVAAGGFCVAVFAGFGALVHLAMYWLAQYDLGWLLAVIGFLCVTFILCSAVIGAVLRLLYRD